MRADVAARLIGESIRVIFPQFTDQDRVTPASLVDAIIMDLSDDSPRRSMEAKVRQAVKLLQARTAAGFKQVLIIEEAQCLSIKSLRALKRICEYGAGFERLLGIILIGQPELSFLLDETRHPELREVTRRITMAEITDLGDEFEPYLNHKLSRVGAKAETIFDPAAIQAIGQRLKGKCYPQSVNELASRSINNAVRYGEDKVTAEIVLAA